MADADVELRTTQAAELLTLALVFGHFTHAAAEFSGAGSGVGHDSNVAVARRTGNITVVTADCGQISRNRTPKRPTRIYNSRQ